MAIIITIQCCASIEANLLGTAALNDINANIISDSGNASLSQNNDDNTDENMYDNNFGANQLPIPFLPGAISPQKTAMSAQMSMVKRNDLTAPTATTPQKSSNPGFLLDFMSLMNTNNQNRQVDAANIQTSLIQNTGDLKVSQNADNNKDNTKMTNNFGNGNMGNQDYYNVQNTAANIKHANGRNRVRQNSDDNSAHNNYMNSFV